jgi:ABC-type Na+ efflux pump permease subunit
MLSFTAMGVGLSTLAPNADSAAPIVSLVFFILIAFSGLYFPIQSGSGLANVVGFFPIRHLILATVNTFNGVPGTSPWGDIGVMAIWGVVGAWVGLRRWDWSPKRG